jgi:CheY-like chemotaxis protein
MKVLLVDDEPGIRLGLAALLRRKGHDVHTAADCAEAQALLCAAAFDVVVTDWRLPDGLAAAFLADCPAPALVVSGHPEEVQALPAVREVLTKPAMPSRLVAAIAQLAPAAAAPSTAAVGTAVAGLAIDPTLPADVQRALLACRDQLPAGAAGAVVDDGTFVTVHAALPPGVPLPDEWRLPHGDLRLLREQDRRTLEFRLRRDGRADGTVPVVAPDAEWPASGPFAVDFHLGELAPGLAAACVAKARALAASGRAVQCWNVPFAVAADGSHGNPDAMPMRQPVGPKLQPELADLWSTP